MGQKTKRVKSYGLNMGQTTISWMVFLANSSPAMSAHVSEELLSMIYREQEREKELISLIETFQLG